MVDITAIIRKRTSCRTYADTIPDKEILDQLDNRVRAEHRGPFGNKPEFQLIGLDMSSPEKWKNIGTYGVIKNARFFLAGKVKNSDKAVVDYGYCMENLILQATRMQLGTCWLGGTFRASGFAKMMNLREDELLPAVSPVGYPARQKSLTEKLFRFSAGSDHRKPWAEIFFAGDFTKPLTPALAGKYAEALENVRLGPSASNRQPWRILLNTATNAYHFYLSRTFGYKLREIEIQDLDMGIAMNHFESTLRELNISGDWRTDSDAPQARGLDYQVSWQENLKHSAYSTSARRRCPENLF